MARVEHSAPAPDTVDQIIRYWLVPHGAASLHSITAEEPRMKDVHLRQRALELALSANPATTDHALKMAEAFYGFLTFASRAGDEEPAADGGDVS